MQFQYQIQWVYDRTVRAGKDSAGLGEDYIPSGYTSLRYEINVKSDLSSEGTVSNTQGMGFSKALSTGVTLLLLNSAIKLPLTSTETTI